LGEGCLRDWLVTAAFLLPGRSTYLEGCSGCSGCTIVWFRPDREAMMTQILAVVLVVALVIGTVRAFGVDLWSDWIPAFLEWRNRSRTRVNHPARPIDGGRAALEADQKRLADLKAEVAAAATRTAERERQLSAKLRKLTVAQRERTEAAGELAEREAALAQRERILERSLAEAERSAAEATARRAPAEGRGAADSDWWEKQLGRPLSAKE
jgi:hypothetical protein